MQYVKLSLIILNQMEQIYTLNKFYRERFGQKVYKLSLDAGMTCPNRDGTLDTRGCIFCSAGGSGDFASSRLLSIPEQIADARQRISNKIKNGKYIAYFQAYTNTYAPIDYLRKVYYEAVSCDDIVGLSIATRPDCIDDGILDLLSELNKKLPVFVELGLQTIHEATVKFIRRGYSLDVFEQTVKNLSDININIVTHLILGLPFETEENMLDSVKYLNSLPVNGVKLQLLHILKHTDLAELYNKGKFNALSLEEYTHILAECIELLRPDIVIHRMTGDGRKSELIAPLWSGDKKMVLNHINKHFREHNIVQGRRYMCGS